MPTPKQVRYHYRRLWILHDKLQEALTEAHNAGVITYDMPKFHEESPCSTHYKTWERILSTTEKSLALAMREEITATIKW